MEECVKISDILTIQIWEEKNYPVVSTFGAIDTV